MGVASNTSGLIRENHSHESQRTKKETTAVATQTQTPTGSEQEQAVAQKIQQRRELYADAPEMGPVALEHVLSALQSELAARPAASSFPVRPNAPE